LPELIRGWAIDSCFVCGCYVQILFVEDMFPGFYCLHALISDGPSRFCVNTNQFVSYDINFIWDIRLRGNFMRFGSIRLNPMEMLRNNFGIKVFVTFILFIVIIFFSFTALFIYAQKEALSDTLVKNGEILASMLARDVRLGVFADNKQLLRDAIKGAMQYRYVVDVRVYNADGDMINRLTKSYWKYHDCPKPDPGMLKRLFENVSISYIDGKETMEFWAQVFISEDSTVGDPFMFEHTPRPVKSEPIGYVQVLFDKGPLYRNLRVLFFNSVALCILFLLVGSVVIYYMVKKIVKPLRMLTTGVENFGKGKKVQKINVDTRDEIWGLAMAFNDMIESLRIKNLQKEKLEQQLRQAHKMEAVGTLAGGIAHDFNNILSIIIGNVSVMKMKMETNSTLKKYIEQIELSAERAANLTKSLLLFSRQKQIDSKPTNLNTIVEDIKKLLIRLVREDVMFTVALADRDLVIKADTGQIGQMLINLVTNAVDAMPDGGSLTVTTEHVLLKANSLNSYECVVEGEYACMTVTDTGEGMDKKTLDRIFEPFFTTKEVGKGTGLGLSMAFGIVQRHNGYIEVDSIKNKGTSFRIYFPLIEMEVQKEDVESSPLPRGFETVLVAEDDDGVRAFSKETLEQYGYKVIEAIDGEDAVDEFYKHRDEIDILLLDVVMPKKNGRVVYEEIRKIRQDIKVIFMSGYTADVMEDKGIDLNRIILIDKPVSADILLRRLREMLDAD